ncbi:ATP-binding cassette domain-containing protein [Mesomycoplasma lagogenitalium]|uniref:ATP-binding cassette domain-containing protein n=1 Tax=Mesomycoplasma lagogenitalium TaxID=171286 RepID=A0ABY8LUJ8_9BACT|nr:ATP-binding cassette domain-containing protein [Mesomycoplasma lagogenitalium]WGI36905.1 ATP-binding cassette domain-containing protein [Mesomycoplasma lagogenitalium]
MQIKVNNIVKIYDKDLPSKFNAIDGVSAQINQGEFISIIGQTGSGKTTFIEHMNGLIFPDAGEIEFVFTDVDKKTNQDFQRKIVISKKRFFKRKVKGLKSIRKRVGVVFQFAEYQLFEQTIEKDIIFGAISMGIPKKQAIEDAKEIIELVGLDQSFLQRSPFDLSGGQKRRVAIAGILAMKPDVIFFDEPTAGLDPAGIEETLKIFDKLNKSGKTIVIATHDLDNALTWTKRTIVFQNGKIIKDGDTYEILSDNEFLKNNRMQPTKLLSFASELERRGMKIGRVTNIDELAEKINKNMEE